MIEISKELLSEVLKIEVTAVRSEILSRPNMLYFETTDLYINREASPCVPNVNIYELAHTCKCNAMLNGFYIKTWFDEITCWCEIYQGQCLVKKFDIQAIEYEAIIKACEWIRKEISK